MLTDTGTGIVHSVMGATLELADQIVVVAGLSVDEALQLGLPQPVRRLLETHAVAAMERPLTTIEPQETT